MKFNEKFDIAFEAFKLYSRGIKKIKQEHRVEMFSLRIAQVKIFGHLILGLRQEKPEEYYADKIFDCVSEPTEVIESNYHSKMDFLETLMHKIMDLDSKLIDRVKARIKKRALEETVDIIKEMKTEEMPQA